MVPHRVLGDTPTTDVAKNADDAVGVTGGHANTPALGDRGRYDLKLWIGSGDGSAAYLPG
jgi:hypothetical protein